MYMLCIYLFDHALVHEVIGADESFEAIEITPAGIIGNAPDKRHGKRENKTIDLLDFAMMSTAVPRSHPCPSRPAGSSSSSGNAACLQDEAKQHQLCKLYRRQCAQA